VYQCLTGYTLDGTAQGASIFHRQCTLTGDFSALEDSHSCKPISTSTPTISNAVMTHYAGQAVASAPARISYPNGVKYQCANGYSSNGARSGHTTLTARVDSSGSLSPALPSQCTLVQFSIRGQVKSASNGGNIDGVKVYIEGTNNAATTSNGFFTLNGVALGITKLVYEKDGLITGKKTVGVVGDMEVGGASDISMSPQMTDNEYRIVVKWGARPTDIDTYLKFGHSKVWYGGGQASSNGLSAMLEHDDTSSYGPETLFLSGMGNCNGGARQCDMRYYVNDYTRTSSMLREGAEVTLYTGDRVAGNWKIADCASSVSGDKNWWHVLTLDGKENKLKWSCDMGASAAPTLSLLNHATGVSSNSSNTQGRNFLRK